eukprot:185578_1
MLQFAEEEFKHEPQQYKANIRIGQETEIKFVQHRESDYIECQNNDHEIENCNVIKRLIHLLMYHQQHQDTQIYEYFASLKNYNISTFMEDWHQVKKHHLRDTDNVERMKYSMNIECNTGASCKHVERYQRDRGNEIYDTMKIEIDYRNVVLLDQLDSIHSFIFHLGKRRNMRRSSVNIKCKYDNENKDQEQKHEEQKHEEQKYEQQKHEQKLEFIWDNKPETISQCNIKQILMIIKEHIFDNLNQKIKDNSKRIIKYLEENEYDGKKITETNRKDFANNLVTYLNDKKMRGPLCQFYTIINKYDVSTLFTEQDTKTDDIWFDRPQIIQQCDPEQIVRIVAQVIESKLHKLGQYKQNIINYIRQNKINGNQINATKRKDFVNNVSMYLDNSKTKGPLGALYNAVIQYQPSILYERNQTENKLGDIWLNKPRSIQQCNVQQLGHVTDYVIIHILPDLIEYKQNIVDYMQQNNMDGNKITEIKNFGNEIAKQLNNNELSLLLSSLRSN